MVLLNWIGSLRTIILDFIWQWSWQKSYTILYKLSGIINKRKNREDREMYYLRLFFLQKGVMFEMIWLLFTCYQQYLICNKNSHLFGLTMCCQAWFRKINSLILTTNNEADSIIISIVQWGNWGTKSLNNFSEATKIKDGRAGIQNRAVWL